MSATTEKPAHGTWELAVLSCLSEKPMHPYEIQRLLRQRRKDEVLVLKRGSLYHAIKRLLASEFIEAIATTRDSLRPERTTYRITPTGEQALISWLREMIAVPRRETSEFTASISFLVHLTPPDAIMQLEERARRLEAEVAAIGVVISGAIARVMRINLLESEYLRAMLEAERQWVRGLVDDLRRGRLTWNLREMLANVHSAKPPKHRTKESKS